jgi:hypothetical protein
VQEVLLAERLRFVYGRMMFSLKDLRRLWRHENLWSEASPTFKALMSGVGMTFNHIQKEDNLYQQGLHIYTFRRTKWNVEEVIGEYTSNECHEIRDKTYGLQGLHRESDRVSVDYAKSVKDILLDMAINMLFDRHSMGFRRPLGHGLVNLGYKRSDPIYRLALDIGMKDHATGIGSLLADEGSGLDVLIDRCGPYLEHYGRQEDKAAALFRQKLNESLMGPDDGSVS